MHWLAFTLPRQIRIRCRASRIEPFLIMTASRCHFDYAIFFHAIDAYDYYAIIISHYWHYYIISFSLLRLVIETYGHLLSSFLIYFEILITPLDVLRHFIRLFHYIEYLAISLLGQPHINIATYIYSLLSHYISSLRHHIVIFIFII